MSSNWPDGSDGSKFSWNPYILVEYDENWAIFEKISGSSF